MAASRSGKNTYVCWASVSSAVALSSVPCVQRGSMYGPVGSPSGGRSRRVGPSAGSSDCRVAHHVAIARPVGERRRFLHQPAIRRIVLCTTNALVARSSRRSAARDRNSVFWPSCTTALISRWTGIDVDEVDRPVRRQHPGVAAVDGVLDLAGRTGRRPRRRSGWSGSAGRRSPSSTAGAWPVERDAAPSSATVVRSGSTRLSGRSSSRTPARRLAPTRR